MWCHKIIFHQSKIQNEIDDIRIWIISCLAILHKINERKKINNLREQVKYGAAWL